MKPIRCAIYTRKSSDEGLDQTFNSLDAQREACAAYIKSQASEGWTALPDLYDDGGISGGTLERPALKRLMTDVADRKIDVIVVYKVDRLSRSLFDFAKLVEQLEKANTSFVSITQPISTTTSMGRLTLNMLLSFAQFEREVTAERIRDKIAASKAKGMWMGGVPPIGYKPDGRSLAIVDEHAELVRTIFRRYLEVGNVWRLAQRLAAEGIGQPERFLATGKRIGGVAFATGQIHHMLTCPLYIGEIHHQGKIHAALHPSIIDRVLWDAVQDRLKLNTHGRRRGPRGQAGSPLAGTVVDEAGAVLLATHSLKPAPEGGKVRYSYFVSAGLQRRKAEDGWRIPARELEGVVFDALTATFANPLDLIQSWTLTVHPGELAMVTARVAMVAARAKARDPELVRMLVAQVRVLGGSIEVRCHGQAIAELLAIEFPDDAGALPPIIVPARLTRSGMAMRLIQGGAGGTQQDRSLVRLVAQARVWWRELRKGELNVSELAARERLAPSYLTRVLRLAFLAPGVTDAILDGKQKTGISVARLLQTDAVNPLWSEQAAAMLTA